MTPETVGGRSASEQTQPAASGADASTESPARPAADASAPVAEVEIKLLCDARTLKAASHASVLARHAAGPAETTQLEATYFDTPDNILLRRKWALRVRRGKAGAYVMTLKTPGADDTSGAFGRNEWNAPVGSPDLDREQLAAWLVRVGGQDVDLSALRPLFSTLVTRQTQRLHTPDGIVEIAADSGEIVSGGRSAPICEIEMELVSGAPAVIFELAEALTREHALRLAIRSKAARGYDLALGRAPGAARAEPVEIDAGASLDAALGAALHAMYAHAMSNLEAASAGASPEGVHQLRVALRRIRSLLGVIHGIAAPTGLAELRAEARWLMAELGHARNLDVFATGVLREAQTVCGADVDFTALVDHIDAMRSQAQEQARAAIASRRCALFLIALGGWIVRRGWRDGVADNVIAEFDAPARNAARRMFRQRYRNVRKKGRGFARLDAAALHRVRLALKKLRYMAEVFQPFLAGGRQNRRFAKRLAQLQDAFGHYNDLHGAVVLLHGLRRENASMGDELALAAGATLGWQAVAQQATMADLRRQWKKFRVAGTPGD
ncbi:CHAD domain-containing protein [Camelimonas sp. ID_303_24]